MVISSDASRAGSDRLRLGRKNLSLQDQVKILDISVNRSLIFDLHVRAIIRYASLRVCPAKDGRLPQSTWHPHITQCTGMPESSAQRFVLDVECRHSHAEVRCTAVTCVTLGWDQRSPKGPAGVCPRGVAGAPLLRFGTRRVPQNRNAGGFPPQPLEAASTLYSEMPKECIVQGPTRGGASITLEAAPAYLDSQDFSHVEHLHDRHASVGSKDPQQVKVTANRLRGGHPGTPLLHTNTDT